MHRDARSALRVPVMAVPVYWFTEFRARHCGIHGRTVWYVAVERTSPGIADLPRTLRPMSGCYNAGVP